MRYITAERDWGTLQIDTSAGIILLREDWQYEWTTLGHGVKEWTYPQKQHFHNRLDREIWGRWSARIPLYVKGSAPFAANFALKPLKLDFDIHWVLHRGQWRVKVFKVFPNTSPNIARAFVIFGQRTITLYSTIFRPYDAGNAANHIGHNFVAGPHEFGHTMNNPDEYLPESPYLQDTNSLMNVGREVRKRHMELILEVLNTMIPGAVFYVD